MNRLFIRISLGMLITLLVSILTSVYLLWSFPLEKEPPELALSLGTALQTVLEQSSDDQVQKLKNKLAGSGNKITIVPIVDPQIPKDMPIFPKLSIYFPPA